MPEQLQKIVNQILEWWKKFNTKQKVLLGSIVATILLALVILAVVVSKPKMITLIECANTAEAGEVKELKNPWNAMSIPTVNSPCMAKKAPSIVVAVFVSE